MFEFYRDGEVVYRSSTIDYLSLKAAYGSVYAYVSWEDDNTADVYEGSRLLGIIFRR